MPNQKVCGFRLSDGTKCKRRCLAGEKRCRIKSHGMFATGPKSEAALQKRSLERSKTRLYARHLLGEQLTAYDAAHELLGSMDEELNLARANLDWAVARFAADPAGGVTTGSPVGDSGTCSIRPWVDVIREHQEIIRRLELVRSQLASDTGATSRGALYDLMQRLKSENPTDPVDEAPENFSDLGELVPGGRA